MKVSIAAAIFVLTLGGTAQAQVPAPAASGGMVAGNFKQACSADIQRLCPASPTPKDQHMCIRQKMAQVSPGCSSFIAAKRLQHQQMKEQGAQGAPPQGGGQ